MSNRPGDVSTDPIAAPDEPVPPSDVRGGPRDDPDDETHDEAHGEADDDLPGPGAAATRGRRFRVDRTLLVVSLLVGLGLALVTRGLLIGITGEERAGLPPLIEQVNPVPEAVQVLSQSNVFVDLETGYTGVLVIDGIEIETVAVGELTSADVEPGQQIQLPPVTIYEPGNATLTFTPTDGAPIERFTEGEHRVQVIYWLVEDGRQRARSFTWTFDVV